MLPARRPLRSAVNIRFILLRHHAPMLRLVLLMLAAMPAAAQEIPSCNQDRVGAVACMSGKLCACGYQRGGIVSGRPDGYHWDCGVLRPACGEALAPPAQGQPQPLPQLYLTLPPPEAPMQPGAPVPPMTPWMR